MKYVIAESQYNRLISKITGNKLKDDNYIGKLTKLISGNHDKQVGDMILNSVNNDNYEFINFKGVDSSVEFSINGLPFTILRNVNNSNNYLLMSTFLNNEPLKVSNKVLKKIFYTIANEHMDVMNFVLMKGYDSM